MSNSPQQPNTIGNASLWLGIASAALVFGIGLCAIVGAAQGWLQLAGTPLLICGASSAFIGLISAGLGFGGLFGKGKAKGAAVAGLILGLLGMCLFFFIIGNLG